MKRNARTVTLLLAVPLACAACKKGNTAGDAGPDVTLVQTDVPPARACTGVDIEAVEIEDEHISTWGNRSSLIVGTEEMGWLVYQQHDPALPEGPGPLAVREVRPGGEIGEPATIDMRGVFDGLHPIDIVDGGYTDGTIHLAVGNDGRFQEEGYGGTPVSYYIEVDAATLAVTRGPLPLWGRCYFMWGSSHCWGGYRFWGGEVYEAMARKHCDDDPDVYCDYVSRIGLIDFEWVEKGRIQDPYEWSSRSETGEDGYDVTMALLGDSALLVKSESIFTWWTIVPMPLDEEDVYWFFNSYDPDSHVVLEDLRSVRDVAVAVGEHTFAIVGDSEMKIFDRDGTPLTSVFSILHETMESHHTVVGYGGGRYCVLAVGREDETQPQKHVQLTLVSEADYSLERKILYCPTTWAEEQGYGFLYAQQVFPTAVHWLGDGFMVAFNVEEDINDENGDDLAYEHRLLTAWVPVR